MKNRFAGVSLNTIFAIFALILAISCNSSMAADVCDVDGNNSVDQNDVSLIFQARNRPLITPFDPMDIDRNGVINTDDARICVCALPTTADCETPLNQSPVTNPGSDQTITQSTFSLIMLDGSASSDADGDLLTYLWTFQQRPPNSQAVLLNADTVSPSFTPDVFGVYVLSLTVTDGFGESSSKVVTVNVVSTVAPPPTTLQAIADSNNVQEGAVASGNILSNDLSGIGTIIISAISHNGQPITLGSPFTTATGGVFLLQADGSYTYTSPSGIQDDIEEVFSYTITDGVNGASSSSTLIITVSAAPVIQPPPPNKIPLARNDTAQAIAGGQAVTGNVLSNDNQGDQPAQVTPVSIASTPNAGSFNLLADGSFTYTPPPTLTTEVQEPFTYTITDSDGETSSAILTITVSPQDPSLLQAQPDVAVATAAGSAITGNVLANDQLGNQPVNVTPINTTTVSGGTFSLQTDGSYTYIPPQSLNAPVNEVFNYTVTSTNNVESSSTLTITVNPPSLIPVCRPDENNVTAGNTAIAGNVLVNDDLGTEPTLVTPITATNTENGGNFSLIANGSFSYTPPATVTGEVTDLFTYTITDSNGATCSSTQTITISPPSLTPFARADENNGTANGDVVTGNVLNNDDLGKEPTLVTIIAITSTENGGTFNLIADGSYSYTPPATVSGVVTELFTYTITDSDGATSSSTLTITISPTPLTPLARPDQDEVAAGGDVLTGNVLTNDDLGKEPTLVTPIAITGTENGGTFNLIADGSYSYTPPQTVAGVITELFTYTITDSDGATSSSTVTIIVSPQGLEIVCRPDQNNVMAGNAAIAGNVLNNDLGKDPIFVTAIAIANTDSGGVFNLLADGSYNYTPPATVPGVVTDLFTYTITDSDGETCSSTLMITISPATLTPFARPDENSVTAGGEVVTGDVLTNDDLGTEPTQATPISVPTTENGGTFNLLADGSYSYAPPATITGVVTESIAYTITDGNGATSTSMLTITVNPAPLTPFARPDETSVTAGGDVVTGNVLTNDDLGIEPTQVTPISVPSTQNGGTFNLTANGSYSYTPPATVSGVATESFTYTITDSNGATSNSTLMITVSMIDLPLARPDENNVTAGGDAITANLLINDDLGQEPTLVTPISIPSTQNGGTFNLTANGSYSYSPPDTVSDVVTESFTYTMTDSNGATSSSTLSIIVSPQGIEIVCRPDENNVIAGTTAITGDVLINDIGTEPLLVTPIAIASTDNGGVFNLLADGSYSYTPPTTVANVVTDLFNYTMTDSDGGTCSSSLTITINPSDTTIPISIPVAQPDTNTVNAGGAAISGNLLANDELGNQPTQVTPVQTDTSTNLGGVFSLQADGSYTYTPPESVDNVAEDVINYTITDTDGETSTSTLAITVNPSTPDNPTPIARPDSANTNAGGAAITGNVLANDDLGDEPTQLSETVTNVQTQQGGVFTLATDGNYTYTPPQSLDNVAEEVINYTITDTDGETSASTLTITVNPANPDNQPLAQPDVATANAGGAAITGNVLTNDELGDEPTQLSEIVTNVQTQQGGVFTLAADGGYTYMPPADISGVVNETFEYTITDSDDQASSSTLTITVGFESPTPQAFPDTISVTAGGAAVTDNVLNNDDKGNEPTLVTPISVATTNNGGTFNLLEDGSYSYLPPATVSGVVTEQYTYTITDSNAETSSSTLTVTINPPTLTPVCFPDENIVTAGESEVIGDVLTNDELGNQPTLVTPIVITGTQIGGALDLQTNGDYTYTPPATVPGIVRDSFNYTITDSNAQTCESTLTITINPPNMIPMARPDENTATEGGDAVTGDVLENDDKGDEPTQVTLNVNLNRQTQGTLDLQDNGVYSYTPPAEVNGVITEQFTYTITDSDGETSSSTLTITVNPVNLMPFARPDELTITAGTAQTGDVSTNDDLGNQQSVITLINDGSNITPVGDLNLQGDGKFTYTPPAVVGGVTKDVFTYTITDNDGETSSSTLTITINPIVENQPPTVDAGVDKIGILDDTTLDGTVSDDGLPNPPGAVTSLWSQVSGLGTATFAEPAAANTTVSFSETGVYVLQLRGDDGELNTVDEVTITVNPDINPNQNERPAVNAGVDKTGILDDTLLEGTVTDDGLPNPPRTVNISWSQVSGPGTATFADPASANTTVSFSETGVYILQLKGDDGELNTVDEVTITVNPDINPNQNERPAVNAGVDKTGILDDTLLEGTVTDDGLPNPPGAVTSSWSQISGPGTAAFADPALANTTVSFPEAGVYTLQLSANDSELTSTDEVTITVNPTQACSPDVNSVNASASVLSGDVSTNDDTGGVYSNVAFGNRGQLTLELNGTYNYFPPANVSATFDDVFNYSVTYFDANGVVDEICTTVLTITVTP